MSSTSHADTNHHGGPFSQPPMAPLTTMAEMKIDILIGDAACYVGTKAQILAEGIVSPDVVWLDTTDNYVEWQSGRNIFRLRRAQPKGIKSREWKSCPADWWRLSIDFAGRIGERQSQLESRQAAIDLAFTAVRPDRSRIKAAGCDDAFQSFKRKVLALSDSSNDRCGIA